MASPIPPAPVPPVPPPPVASPATATPASAPAAVPVPVSPSAAAPTPPAPLPWYVPDPLPQVHSALLHSGDVARYARALAAAGRPLFAPFDEARLKSASYEISFLGDAYFWREDCPDRQHVELTPGKPLTIPKNGIVFFSPNVVLSLPPFLAFRFNLRIKWVHRGLLLGTGPLVDPGFHGRLLIPVHNLTDQDAVIGADEGFIWIEVTKVSPLNPNDNDYKAFDPKNRDIQPWQYFEKANSQNPILSAMHSAAKDIESARTQLNRQNIINWITSVLAVVGVVGGLAGVAWATIQIMAQTRSDVATAAKERHEQLAHTHDDDVAVTSKRIEALEKEVADLKAEAASQALLGKGAGAKSATPAKNGG